MKIFTYFRSRDHRKNMLIFIFMCHNTNLCKNMKIENVSFCRTAVELGGGGGVLDYIFTQNNCKIENNLELKDEDYFL